jgi:integrase
MKAPLKVGSSPSDAWAEAPVSPWSRFGDDEWRLDIRTAGRRADQNRVSWRLLLPSGTRIAPEAWFGLVHAAKQFLWSMAVNPPTGRKRLSATSLQSKALLLKTVIVWMALDGLASFRDVDRAAVERLRAWLLARPGQGRRRIVPNTVVNYMIVLKDLYRQRAKLDDAIPTDPFPDETTYEAAGLTRANKGAIPFIPDAVAIALLNTALKWVEEEGQTIVEAETIRRKAHAFGLTRGAFRQASHHVRKALKRAGLTGPSGELLDGAYAVRHAATHLIEACYIVIAGFVGMRVSEILSMEVGATEYRPIGETGLQQPYIVARLFKTVDQQGGRLERWLAPEPVVKAVGLLEQLNAPLREASGRRELFLVKNTQYGEIVPVTQMHMGWRINDFARHVGVPLHEGKPWAFSTHQFRKTFARFIARRDRSQLLGLAEHYKHASVAMTARGYVGSDFDLHQLIDHESRAETAAALDRLLVSDRLAGRMGERIAAGNARFRGRAGEQVRRDYIAFVLRDTDLRIYACDYGWCMFQPETARCGGEAAPSEAGRSPAVCLGCANMVIDARHAPYWRDRRERNAALIPGARPLTAAVLTEAVEQCDRVLAKIGGHDERR